MVGYIPVDLLREKLGELEKQKKLSIDEIEKLRAEFPHSIQLAEQSPAEMVALPFVNCVMYALNLKCDDLYRAIATDENIRRRNLSREGDKIISADTEFVEYCIKQGLVPTISNREPESGDLVVYSDSDRCRHVGKLLDQSRIRSKWGMVDLFEHELLEVPDFYGDNVEYFESLRFEQAQDGFIAYAKSVVEDNPQAKLLLDNAINSYT